MRARLCTQVFSDRNWDSVSTFYSRLPPLASLTLDSASESEATDFNGPSDGATCPLSNGEEAEIGQKLPGCDNTKSGASRKAKGGKWDRATWQIEVAYNGAAFAGWQRQNGLHTVQGGFTRRRKSAHSVDPASIIAAINSAAPGIILALSAEEVPRSFHPVFSARWRRYIYLLPLNRREGGAEGAFRADPSNTPFFHQSGKSGFPPTSDPEMETQKQARNVSTDISDPATQPPASIGGGDDDSLAPPAASTSIRGDGDGAGGAVVPPPMCADSESGSQWYGIDVAQVDDLLRMLVDRPMCFTAVARDTKAGRSSGAATVCHLYRAQACIAVLPPDPGSKGGERQRVMCVELIANRFLRRMVRVLVGTAIREAGAGGRAGALERLLMTGERRATAPPMPPQGHCLADVGYSLGLPPPIVGR